MKCPHCRTAFHEDTAHKTVTNLGSDTDAFWRIWKVDCPACKKIIVKLNMYEPDAVTLRSSIFVRPYGAIRPYAPTEVPKTIADDYNEACLVLPFSAKASAALSRRCLQHLLREIAKVKHDNLSKEIDEAMISLPTQLSTAIDGIRNIGNFSAHPQKSKHTGEIIDVEPEEAEWNLDVLEELFDHYCVKPEHLKKKRDAMNKKLEEAGKPKMK